MSNSVPPFSSAEYDRRLHKTRVAMEARGIDVLIATDPSNQAWLTGYDGWSFYVHQAVILPLEGTPVWWGRNQDTNGAVRTVDLERTAISGYPDNYVQSTERHPMQHLARRLKMMGYENARIGVEMENYYFSAKAYTTLLTELPQAEIVDATALVNWQRTVKSMEEIAFMRKAAAITQKIQNFALERAEPGMRKNDLAAEITAEAIRGVGDDWGDYPAIVPLLPSGTDAAAPHLTWNGDVMKTGEATFFELSGCYRRYHAPLSRTVFLGKPPAFLERAEAALIEGLEAGLAAARPGNRACDIANALGDAMDRAGIDRGARCGYPVGLSYPPDWGERTISLRPEDETILQPGMTFHFMPGIWMEDWGLEITESILIRHAGPAETFCKIPRKIFVKD
ncbi:ectoine hydrolase DoeA [Pacificitalea manganoxidans]|uniref:Ectoine hydrolase DoeA n=1 Tax=Pacificitalea manganoxidans TaxID=1411902 RepID=A0A291M1G6_9RHOB|nr:M24 family metallopeptidase [Pacificitalea manganoxidans]ATI42744.1 ectoine hydrolase DoeA [Pacificitalea manganoxidans]MDR6307360.1 ectoine hydrolase [Pacificitalea manganoxidans]OWU68878.1 X-Pro dipeptidase [Roseovarius sp. 22II1-1F6A]